MGKTEITFTDASPLTYAEFAEALYRCYDNFEERMAGFARHVGETWQPRRDQRPTPEDVSQFVKANDLDLALSVLGYDGSDLIAIALLGRRGSQGWLGEFAVAPSHRGRGLGHVLLQQFLARARAAGIREISFDVLTVNTPAIRIYERAGFRACCEQHELLASRRDLALGPSENTQRADSSRLKEWYERIMAEGEPEPCWERRLPSLLASGNLTVSAYHSAGEERAILAYRAEDTESGRSVSLSFGGFAANAGPEELTALISAAAGPADASFRAGLEPVQSRFYGLLRGIGFRVGRRSFEMRMALASG